MSETGDRLRNLGAVYWQPVVSAFAALVAGWKSLTDALKGTTGVETWVILGSCAAVFVAIRFRRVAVLLTKLIIGSSERLRAPKGIFRGLLRYRAGEKLPGRDAEVAYCWTFLEQNRFLILEGESGCGKSSLLDAGLLPLAGGKFKVIYSRLSQDPIGRIRSALQDKPYDASAPYTSAPEVGELIADIAAHTHQQLLICLDQFEEVFRYLPEERRLTLMSALAAAVQKDNVSVI